MFNKIKKFFQAINGGSKNSKKTKYIILLAMIGIFLILISNIFSDKKEVPVDQDPFQQEGEETDSVDVMQKENSIDSEVKALENSYQKDLATMLEKIKGVSDVEVMVNVDSTNVNVYEKDLIKAKQSTEESDKNGGTRKVDDHTEETDVILIRQGDKEVPLLVQTKKPNVRGVFIVAKGVDHATVKKWVVESVAKVLEVPTHKVSVMPKE